MKKSVIIIAAAKVCPAIFTHASESPLAEYKWKNRVLILLAPADDSRLAQQKAKLNMTGEAMNERDLIILEETNPSGLLHRYFKPDAPFSAFLVGKDGETKWQSFTLFNPQIVFTKIDSMPMRADEKRK